MSGATTNAMADADRFVDLACLTYGDDESRARRNEAAALIIALPSLVRDSVHAAAAAGDADALRAHLDRDPGCVSRAGSPRTWGPLLALCYSRVPQRDPLACLELLLARGADPNAHVMLYENKFTALTGVMGEGESGPLDQPPHAHARAMAERLRAAGARVLEEQGLYNTHFSPENGWLELLLARGLPPDHDYLMGPAVRLGFTDRVRLLLAHGASANGTNRWNTRTHIENALLEGHGEVARMLFAAGATAPSLSADERFRVAVVAADTTEALRLLAASPHANEHPGALIAAARHGRLEAVRLALQLGLPIDGVDRDGLTALHHAAQKAQLEVVRELVLQGAPLDVKDPQYGGTPLGHARHFASRWPHPHAAEVVAFLEAAAQTG